jgi:hypothetical protein
MAFLGVLTRASVAAFEQRDRRQHPVLHAAFVLLDAADRCDPSWAAQASCGRSAAASTDDEASDKQNDQQVERKLDAIRGARRTMQ